jgi:hypothetical protein
MKTINVQVYTFSELEKDIQEKVLENFRHFNTEHNWWEDVYHDFINILSFMGIETSTNDIFFSGFDSQGNGSTYASKVDVMQLIKAVNDKAWIEYAPKLELNLSPCPIHKKVIGLIANGKIEVSLSTEIPNRGYWIKLDFEQIVTNRCVVYNNIEEELEKLEKWALDTLKTLNKYLYGTLENQYEHLVSDSAVQESITVNDYMFFSNGEQADWLLSAEH